MPGPAMRNRGEDQRVGDVTGPAAAGRSLALAPWKVAAVMISQRSFCRTGFPAACVDDGATDRWHPKPTPS
jgi:hypothetical protein